MPGGYTVYRHVVYPINHVPMVHILYMSLQCMHLLYVCMTYARRQAIYGAAGGMAAVPQHLIDGLSDSGAIGACCYIPEYHSLICNFPSTRNMC
jgi:hypothetical protein